VRVKLAQHVAHGARRFLVLGGRAEAQFAHGVDDAPLHRLEAVAEVRQGAVQHHVHRVVEVGGFGVFAQRDPFVVAETLCDFVHVIEIVVSFIKVSVRVAGLIPTNGVHRRRP
jgi:hypothetical protein